MSETYKEIFKIGLFVVLSITFSVFLFLLIKDFLKREDFKDLNLIQKLFGKHYLGIVIILLLIFIIIFK